ncbi:hypothetical protein AB6A40_005355 [Gnathostoma spinigerum]|uniref:Mannosyltransferase n=1 Tax=Gnathostoma spinigerum TaxID=75299 RepID=A0ABD6EHF1_9BILA
MFPFLHCCYSISSQIVLYFLILVIIEGRSLKYWHRFLPVLFIFLSLLLWIMIFFSQPHKEERFLFPVYSLIAVLAAVTLDAIPRLGAMVSGESSRRFWSALVAFCLVLFACFSLSRSAALHRNYAAPIDVYKGFNEYLATPEVLDQPRFAIREDGAKIRLCVGKEWYRFPSSFFLPSQLSDSHGRRRSVELAFIKSEFSGLLPKPFAAMSLPAVTRAVPTEMNDLNKEEPSRYVSVESCDFLVDLETPDTTATEPNYAQQNDTWKSVVHHRFLISSLSDPVFRAFYIPFTPEARLRFGMYHILERKL